MVLVVLLQEIDLNYFLLWVQVGCLEEDTLTLSMIKEIKAIVPVRNREFSEYIFW